MIEPPMKPTDNRKPTQSLELGSQVENTKPFLLTMLEKKREVSSQDQCFTNSNIHESLGPLVRSQGLVQKVGGT